MDRLVDHLFVFTGEGEIKDFPGNYTQFREEKGRLNTVIKENRTENTLPSSNTENTSKNNAENRISYKEKENLSNLKKRWRA